ncbi:MAG: tetratricopeptide (TPR) repeat protein [Flavobacteriales bacterium]|jgi:tetratricopeptide (TPR) repeat protein
MSISTKRFYKTYVTNIILVLVAVFGPDKPVYASDFEIDYYIKSHGIIEPRDVPEVYEVFTTMVNIADKSTLYWPELIVVNDTEKPLILALKDGHILITKKTIDTIFLDVNLREAHTRLAFIFGHELSHLAHNDFLNDEITRALSHNAFTDKAVAAVARQTHYHAKETRADQQGFLYAATAGYPVNLLLENKDGHEDFFSFWLRETNAVQSKTHPSAAQRIKTLRDDLKSMGESLDYFYFAQRLSHFGEYEQAIELYQAFQKHFPSKEVLNNLGYCYIKMAMALMDTEQAYHYWLPVIAENESILSTLRAQALHKSRGPRDRGNSDEIHRLLNRAVRYLELAIEKDVNHIRAYINLSAAYYYLASKPETFNRHISLASAAAESAYIRSPQTLEIKTLRAIMFKMAKIDSQVFRDALTEITRDVEQNNSPLYGSYNLSQLLPKNHPKKEQLLKNVKERSHKLPKILQFALCENNQLNNKERCFTLKTSHTTKPTKIWPQPVGLSRDLIFSPLTEQEMSLYQWQEKVLTSNASIYTGRNQEQAFQLLVIDDIVKIITYKKENFGNSQQFLENKGAPLYFEAMQSRTLWIYPSYTALFEKDRLKEIWLSN